MRHVAKQGRSRIRISREGGRGVEEQSRREKPLAAEEMSWLGFSEVVNQEHQRVRAFKGELKRN